MTTHVEIGAGPAIPALGPAARIALAVGLLLSAGRETSLRLGRAAR